MDFWIRSDSERAIGGLMAVVAILLPWDITYIAEIGGGSLLYVRFPLFEFQYAMGIQTSQPIVLHWIWAAADLHATGPLAPAYTTAVAGGVITVIGVILGTSITVAEEGSFSTNTVYLLAGIAAVATVATFVAVDPIIAPITAVLTIGLLVTGTVFDSSLLVRVLGCLLLTAGAAFLIAWYYIVTRGAVGIDLPLGALVTTLLGATLLLAERR